VRDTLSASYTHGKRKISIRTINLDQPWKQICTDLSALVA